MPSLEEYEDIHPGALGESHTLKVEGIKSKERGSRTFILSDQQAGYHDKKLHQLVLAAIKVFKPERIVLPGDLVDFPAVSRYSDGGAKESVQESVNSSYGVLADYRNAAGPDCKMDYVPGNHEHRLTKFLLKQAPQIFGVKAYGQKYPAMSVPHLLRLEELEINWIGGLDPNEYPLAHVDVAPGLVCYHGWMARKHGGMSALASLENKTSSLIVGHTHRLAHVIKTVHHNHTFTYLHAIEAGTLCTVSGGLDWTVDPNWQNGFVIINNTEDDWNVQLVPWQGGNTLVAPPYIFSTDEQGKVKWRLI